MFGSTHARRGETRRRSLGSRFGALSLACTMVAGFVGIVAVTPAGAAGVDIKFDGYCDGLHLNLPSSGLPSVAYTLDGNQTISGPSCTVTEDGVIGVAKPNKAGVYGVRKGTEYVAVLQYKGFFQINKNKTWTLFKYSGSTIVSFSSGTWSPGHPGPTAHGVSTVSRAHAAPAARVHPANTKNIIVAGYCDGFRLQSPSLGLGTAGSLDGADVGTCLGAEQPLIGVKTTINGQKNTYVAIVDLSDYVGHPALYTALFFPDHTFSTYGANGASIFLANSGIWGNGVPAKATHGKSIFG